VWPLTRFVITEYKWEEQVRVRGPNGLFKDAKNQEPSILGKDGKPLRYALFLRDFNGQMLVNFYDDPMYGINPVQGLAVSPDENYLYSVCAKWDQPAPSWYKKVCRYPLSGKTSQWEEAFMFDQGDDRYLGNIQDVSVAEDGNIYFLLAGARQPYNGIWRFINGTKQFERITKPQGSVDDTAPRVSPDGNAVAFLRSGTLFIAKIKGTSQ
jgi:hypothetical protein